MAACFTTVFRLGKSSTCLPTYHFLTMMFIILWTKTQLCKICTWAYMHFILLNEKIRRKIYNNFICLHRYPKYDVLWILDFDMVFKNK